MNETPEGDRHDLTVTSEEESSAQLVSRFAQSAQQRQEVTQREARRERPDFILDVEQSEVRYTLHPKFLPLAHINYPTFAKFMQDKWGMSLDSRTLKIDPTVFQRVSQEEGENDGFESRVMQHVLRERKPAFGFSGGKYPVSKHDFVQILGVQLNYESVLVSVAGIGQVAEAIAQEVLELVNFAAGADRPWSNLEDEVQVVGYATRTKVDLGSGSAFHSLLSSRFLGFLESEVIKGQQFGAHAGGYHSRHGLGVPPNPHVVFALDDLTIRIISFDEDTGYSWESDLRFSVTTRGDYGLGRVSISSELPYDVHEKCVGKLIESLSAAG